MHVHDVLIVGAGPAGLAAAARLCEHTPSATFTDDEHQRYHWIQKHGRKMNIRNYKTNANSLPYPLSTPSSSKCGCDCHDPPKDPGIDMVIVDAEGASWMTRWNRLFQTFGIEFLRSPMFFHVDPADRDALLGYMYETGREEESFALPGCVGKEVSKHRRKKKMSGKGRFLNRTPIVDERDRKDYFNPSTKLFQSHCEEVARRYGMDDGMVKQETVLDIVYGEEEDFQEAENNFGADVGSNPGRKIFQVKTDMGTRYAHVVILAVGPGNTPSIPDVIGLPSSRCHEGFAHAMHIQQIPPPQITAKIQRGQATRMLIVGGGLTSVQIADLALKKGVDKVHLLMRGPIKVKYFDMDLEWVAKFRNYKQAEFWSADDDGERYEMYTQARNGGSMNPRYRKILDAHVAAGKISFHTHTSLQSVAWDSISESWKNVITSPASNIPDIDYIVFATGIQTDVSSIPYLQTIHKHHRIRTIGGFPCLNDDLMWSDAVPLFATGRLAGLRLGPGAPNLIGCRVGAERIAWNVEDVLRKTGQERWREQGGTEVSGNEDDLGVFAAARNNRFGSLQSVEASG